MFHGVPYTHINPTSTTPQSSALPYMQSPFAPSISAFCAQPFNVLSSTLAIKATMANIHVIPLRQWLDKGAQVVMCVKLKYVQ